MPTQSVKDTDVNAVTTGWGKLSERGTLLNILQELSVKVIIVKLFSIH